MTGLEGARVLVTGGASGIGLATARLFADAGARVACLDRACEGSAREDRAREDRARDDSARDGRARDGRATHVAGDERLLACRVDVADDASVRSGVVAAAEAFGGIDVLVNNAGIGARGTVADNDDEEWRHVLDVDVIGIARVSRAALPYLRASPQPAIVNTCSIAACAGLPNRALYSAAKGAVYSLTLAMAADHLREGIRVNCVTPGTADTPWVQRLLDAADDPAAERAALEARQPSGRLVTAEEVAGAIVYLAAPHASAVTGVALPVDGGMAGLRLPAAPTRANLSSPSSASPSRQGARYEPRHDPR